MRRKPLVLLSAGGLLVVGACFAKHAADKAALRAAGYRSSSESETEFFATRARPGLTPAQVARALRPPSRVERFISPVSGGDSVLLERYVYTRGIGSWPVYIYYTRGGGVNDVYAQDVPSTNGSRSVSADEAEEWRVGVAGPRPR